MTSLETLAVATFHLSLFAAVALHLLSRRREPMSTVYWLAMAWSLPFLGAMLYAMFGVYRLPKKGWRKEESDRRMLAELKQRERAPEMAYWEAVHNSVAGEPADKEAQAINRALDPILEEYPLLGGNALNLLVTGDEAYPAMLAAIRSARKHVHIQTFIIGNDRVAREFLDLLATKAREGVTVRLLYDVFGSTHAVLSGLLRRYRKTPHLHIAGWTQANPFKLQLQLNLRNHRKIMVIDGERAFTGGININTVAQSEKGRPADRDIHFEVRGPAVQELQYTFLRDWFFMTGEAPEELLRAAHFPPTHPQGSALVRIAQGGPTSHIERLTDLFFTCITSARRQILAVTPYFVPNADLLRALCNAAQRGVDTTLLVPSANNHFYAGLAGRALYQELLDAGVKIFERRPPFMHTKAMIIDQSVAVVGSANLDVRSLRLNYESNLVVYDDRFIATLKGFIAGELNESDEIRGDIWRQRPRTQHLAENICYVLSPLL